MASPSAPLRRNADFIRLWVSAGVSRLGTSLTMAAFPLLVLWHTGSAAATGLVTFAAALPGFLVQLPAGALVDRLDRRKLMIGCDVVGVLVVSSVAATEVAGRFWLPHLMAAAFLLASVAIVYQLSERATVRHVVSPGQLPAALSQNEARGAAIGLLGQPGGSALFTLARWLPFATNALAALVALVLLLFIRRRFTTEQPPGPREPLRAEVTAGVRWVWRRRFLRTMVGIFAGSNLVFQVLLLSVMVIVHDGGHAPAVVGVVVGAGGIGGVLGALCASWWLRRASLYRTVVTGFAVWTVLVPLSVLARDPLVLIGTLAGISFVASLFNVAGGIYQMRVTPDELQGRVNGATGALSSVASAIGALGGGWLLDRAGLTATGVGVGVIVLLLTVTAAVSPVARAEGRDRQTADAPAP
ncbi:MULTISPECIES: MFS transporter [Streptomyces]|uniref:MFS transporter n=1 Tax=Streptomyces TaxID=1883 RepID=UPI001E3A5045|nr:MULTISPECIES: MFS transporter [Streptomyces]UFQ18547.1 MFS transporter [Streptomyces huasconensis]WCL88161.1 MFS transporter [Streptomyces sp. JCM 35825]